MWCRTILTAVAISYVLCMLLWSGLQKEDLDASTLEKLSRYNVNIGDLNNEQLRQQCLLNQITTVPTEVPTEASTTSTTNERLENDVTVGIYPKIGILLAANFEEKTVVQFNSSDTKSHFEELRVNAPKNTDLRNVTNEENKAIIKIEYNIHNQPDVESVINFWTKLTHRTTTVATLPTTLVAPVNNIVHENDHKVNNGTKAQTDTQNDGYVHSREMEYISRILAEYLASQTVPTTTESVTTKKVFPTKYREVLNKAAVEEESIVDHEQDKEINNINATQDKSHSDKAIYNSMVDEGKSKAFKTTLDSELMKMIRDTPPIQSKPVDRRNAKGILDRLLRMKNDLFNNGFIISESELESKTTNKSNENQDKTKSFKLLYLFQNMNDANDNNSHNVMKDNDQSTNATIKAETMVTNKLEPEVGLTDSKKSNIHQNLNLDHTGSRFRAMLLLPPIKYSKQTETKSEEHEHEPLELHSVKKAIVSQQPAAIEKFAKNQLFKMKNDTFTADTEITSNVKEEIKTLDEKQLKKAPVFQELKLTNDSKKIKAIKEILKEYGQENEQITVKSLTQTKNVDSMNVSVLRTIPASVITEIAEQVKRMVLKDIGQNITTTTVGTPLSISTTTTAEPAPTSLQNEFTQSNHVMQKLMEIFKELNAMKDTAKLINQMPQNASHVRMGSTTRPQLGKQTNTPASFNPYLMQNLPEFKPIQANSYVSNVPAPSGVYSQHKPPLYLPPLNAQPTKDYHIGAITIQTNSDEIAPLPIQMSKPSKLMNQHIVLTTKGTVDKIKKERERESVRHVEAKFRIPKPEDRTHRDKLEDVSDLPKNVRFAEKHEVRDRYSYRGGYLDREKPLYHEYREKVHNIEQPIPSRFPELHYPGRLAHLEHSGRPRDLSTSEDSNPPRYSRPGFNDPGRHKSGIKYHPGPYSHSARGRPPRYESTKFHEKLERIENWPRSTWKDFHSPSDSSNDEVPARQQMPLVKVKKRTKYDDTHFTNFLKSQKKVTDMLEKILANNLKDSSPHSVETP